jgi:hypothetical protein
MTTRQFLRIAAATFILAVTSILGGAAASAQCNCQNTITMDPGTPCCIQARDAFVQCDDGSTQQFDASAPPFTTYCRGNRYTSPCPCPNSTNAFVINLSGTLVPIPAPGAMDVRYGGDCCLHIVVTQNPSGCIDVVISAAPIC